MSCCPSVNVIIQLIPLGGQGCGIEVASNTAFSIGDQPITAIYADPCSTISSVFLNGFKIPVMMPDGFPINISVVPTISYTVCSSAGPLCIFPSSSSSPTANQMNMMAFRRQLAEEVRRRIKIIKGR
jgi:hypothetical protein